MLPGPGLLQQLDLVPAFRLFRELLQVSHRGEGGCALLGCMAPGLKGDSWLQGSARGR